MNTSLVRRRRSGLAAAALASIALATLTACGSDATSTDKTPKEANAAVAAASAWLATNFDDAGLIAYDQGGAKFPDVGMTIDAITTMARFDVEAATVERAVDALVADQSYGVESTYSADWENPDSSDTITAVASNALAKKVVAIQAIAPSSAELPALVESLEEVTEASGRISDGAVRGGKPDPASDYANTFGQGFAARALVQAGSSEGSAALGYLLDQQCKDGSFVESIAPIGAAAGACDGEEASTGASATVAMQLANIDPDKLADLEAERLQTALDSLRQWLLTDQAADGSFGAGGTYGSNANDTGLAGSALASLGETDAASDAAAWISELQDASGAVAYNAEALADAEANGIATESQSQWLSATTQALAVLALSEADPGAKATK